MFLLCMMMLNIPSYDVVWDHQDVYIEVYDEVTSYTMLPEATLMIDGKTVETDEIFYERGVDRTFLSVLSSVELKTFYIKYRVHFLSYDITHTQTIAFHIVDTTPPEVALLENIIIKHNEDIDILNILQMKDNYDEVSHLTVTIEDSFVKYDDIGVYPLKIIVADTSGNQTIIDTFVSIKDYLSPIITRIKEVVIHPKESIEWPIFFEIKDDLDEVVDVVIDDKNVDYNTEGIYQAMLCARDLSFNQSCQTFNVHIKDNRPPEVILKNEDITLEVNEPLTNEMMHAWFIKIEDDFDDELIINFNHNINIYQIGMYDVIIDVMDQASNAVTHQFEVEVIDRKAPQVYMLTTYIEVFDPLLPMRAYFYIEDNYYSENTLTIKIREHIDQDMLGIYEVQVEVSDPSKNKRTYVFFIEVVDSKPPILNMTDALIITNFERPEYLYRLNIEDNYDTLDAIHVDIDDESIRYEVPGMYNIMVTLQDASGNTISYYIDIIIVDIIPPVIRLYEETQAYELGITEIDFKENIQDVSDNISQLTVDDVLISEDVDYDNPGVYDVYYEVADDAESLTVAHMKVYIEDTTAPTVDTTPLFHTYQEPINVFEGIDIFDLDDTHISLITNGFSPEIGSYMVTYIIYDDSGNETIIEREIFIVSNTLFSQVKPYMTSVMLLLLGFIVSGVLKVVFSKNHFDNFQKFKYNNHNK